MHSTAQHSTAQLTCQCCAVLCCASTAQCCTVLCADGDVCSRLPQDTPPAAVGWLRADAGVVKE
eukprot:SAG25_NODE_11022_length_316_cov_0.686636_1_plen_63_part_01